MRETFIDGDKTILKTDFYLYLLQIENNWEKLKKWLEDRIKEEYVGGCDICSPCRFETKNKIYQDILERVKNDNNE